MKRLFTLLSLVIGLTVSVQAVTYCSTSAFGYGRSATGGGDATPTLVSTVDQLSAALNKGKNKVIIITQSLTFTSMLSVQDGANITLLGLPGVTLTSLQQTSGTSGILYIKRFDNLIIRNLTFVGPGAYDCDGNDLLCFEKVTNAWVDHCDFQDGCDGNFDNKSLTDNVTVSWCRFRYLKEPKAGGSGGSDDHRYTNLLGASSDDKPSDGTYNFTWAYCWWDDGCVERMVRCRNASLHFLNCYWNSSVANYYIGPQNADAYVEGCYIEGKPASSKIFYQNYGGTNGVKFVNSYAAKGIPSNVTNRTVVTPGYSYTALSYSEAKSAVTNSTCGAGATLIVTTAGAVSSSCDGGSTTTYTVTWDATTNGGSCSTATTQVVAGNAIGTLPTATKSGYTFNGWFTAATGGTQISASTVITGNVTYYAQFTESQGSDPTPEGDITWNFSRDEFNGLGTITATTTIQGLTMVATSSATMTVDANNKTIGDITFTHRLKTGGTGNADSRHLWFDVKGDCTIDFYVMSASSSDRVMNIAMGEFGNVSATIPVLRSDSGIRKYSYSYSGSEAKILIYSDAGGGINFYGIRLTYPDDPVATYTVTWQNYDGDVLETDENVEEGSTPVYNGSEPIRDNNDQYTYTFTGWAPAISPITADITYTAQFDSTVNTYLVEFYNWNSVLLQSSKWEYGATPVYSGPAITREDDHQNTYTFAGWDPQIEPVTEEAFYFATFSSQLRTFSANDVVTSNDPDMGSVAISPQQNEYEYGEQITVTATPQQGYEFSGWQNEDDEIISTDATTTITVTDSTLTAIFVPNTNTRYLVHHLQQNLNDDLYTLVETDTLYGTTGRLTQVETVRRNYPGFDIKYCENVPIAADGSTELNALYDRLTYSVRWVVEDAERLDTLRYGAMPDYGSVPTKAATAQYTYTFAGWDPEVVTVTADATYRAVFSSEVNRYTVTFHANGHATDPEPASVEYGHIVNCTTLYADDGWIFDGWFREAGCQTPWDCLQDVVTADIDLYAKWIPSENMFYWVNYWQQNIYDDDYTLVEFEQIKGTTGQMTQAEAKTYTGFTMLPFSQVPIAPNTEVNIYYDRLRYEVHFVVEGVVVQSDSLRYYATAEYRGDTPTKPDTDTHYYTFWCWDKATNIAITEDITFTALFNEWPKDPTGLSETDNQPVARKVMMGNHVYIIIGNQMYDILGNKQ